MPNRSAEAAGMVAEDTVVADTDTWAAAGSAVDTLTAGSAVDTFTAGSESDTLDLGSAVDTGSMVDTGSTVGSVALASS